MRPPRIIKILKVEPFKITSLWTNGDVRLNDFSSKLDIFRNTERLKPLLDFEKFSQVSINDGDTFSWENIQYVNTKGNLTSISFDPDTLFTESVLAETPPIIEIDSRREFTQSDYANRNGLTASKVRTWVKRGKLKSRYVPHLGITLIVT
ncbi:hypothetical protein LV89_01935 [Arcicella aurantiaca]|uniref:Uncharacterized protein n=1 Tax=Arcicella aurantiaca TaxID=591202 RepID=A0A316EB00_9BACT|nr:hypothetical protein [Arcicella aurantiaca]PWK27121.1 hypothetical protein LV89_01935 [Arcicella aurantiaca]